MAYFWAHVWDKGLWFIVDMKEAFLHASMHFYKYPIDIHETSFWSFFLLISFFPFFSAWFLYHRQKFLKFKEERREEINKAFLIKRALEIADKYNLAVQTRETKDYQKFSQKTEDEGPELRGVQSFKRERGLNIVLWHHFFYFFVGQMGVIIGGLF